MFQCTWPKGKPLEDVFGEWVKKSSKLLPGALSQHAIEHLASSGLQRHGQAEPEHHWHGKTPEHKLANTCPPTVTTTDGDRCRDAGTTCQRCGRQTHPRKDCWHRHEICQNCVDMPVRTRCKTNRAQKSQSRKFGVPLFMTLSAMVIVMAPNTPRLRRVAKNLFCAARRVKIQQHLLNIKTGQTSQKSSRTSRRLNIFKI